MRKIARDLLERNEIPKAKSIIREAAGGNKALEKKYLAAFNLSLAHHLEQRGDIKEALGVVAKIDEENLDRSLRLVVRAWLAGRAGGLKDPEKKARLEEVLAGLPDNLAQRTRAIVRDYWNEAKREIVEPLPDEEI